MINIRVSYRKNPGKEATGGTYRGQTVSHGAADLDILAKRISASCTVTASDCYAVLTALQEQMINSLHAGERVKLGSIGTFRLSCNSAPAEKPEDFSCSDITRLRVIFCPGKHLREAVKLTNPAIKFNNLYKKANSYGLQPDEEEKGAE